MSVCVCVLLDSIPAVIWWQKGFAKGRERGREGGCEGNCTGRKKGKLLNSALADMSPERSEIVHAVEQCCCDAQCQTYEIITACRASLLGEIRKIQD